MKGVVDKIFRGAPPASPGSSLSTQYIWAGNAPDTPFLLTENSEVMASATVFLPGLLNPGPRATVPHGIIKELWAMEAQSREFF